MNVEEIEKIIKVF